jgi:hypothetical protein
MHNQHDAAFAHWLSRILSQNGDAPPLLSESMMHAIGQARERALFGDGQPHADTLVDLRSWWERGLLSDRELAERMLPIFSPAFERMGLGPLTDQDVDEMVSAIRICHQIRRAGDN